MAEQEQVKGEVVRVGWFFWVYSTLLVLVLIVVGVVVEIPLLILFLGLVTYGLDDLILVAPSGMFLGGGLGVLTGLGGGIWLVRRMHRKRRARLASKHKPDAE